MSTADIVYGTPNKHSYGHRIEGGHYGQRMYYIDTDERVSESNQEMINAMLLQNQAVGIMGGFLDERLTICMVSGLAVKILGFDNVDEFLAETNAELVNLTEDGDYPEYFRNRLSKSQKETIGGNLKGKGGKSISLRMNNIIVTSETGRRMWYIAIRRFGEVHHDSLTGGYNRHGFLNYIKSMKENGVDLRELAIICTNIKGFKAINDLYGSEFGDTLLINAYSHFNSCELKPIACARRDADRFVMLVEKKNINLERLPETMKIPYIYGDKKYYANCIMGIYCIEDNELPISTMIDHAQLAKENVQDAFVKPYMVYEPSMKSDYISRTVALTQFDEALAKDEFQVYYQPVVDCKTHKVVSAEALIRWQTKDVVLSPGIFIPAFEENGCIVKLDEYVLTKVIRHLRNKVQCGQSIIPVSVNLSRMDFFDTERTDRLYKICEADPFIRKYVHFEITETSFLSVKEKQAEFIKNINALGGVVYIDDFGTVNSSIDMLVQYDFGVLKLDTGFVRSMVQDRKARTLVGISIYTAHELGMKVVAEGVETEEQLKLLQDMNCDYIQGYYFSKPLSTKDFDKYLGSHEIA